MRIHMDFSCGLSERLAEVHHADKNSVTKKLKMLDVCTEIGLGRITVAMVLTRGVNESHMEDLFTIARRYPKVIREIAYRSQGNVGRYIKDKDGNENIKLFISTFHKNILSVNEVLDHCKKYLTGYKIPKFVEFIDEIPKSNVGKILRRELRKRDNG